jgi:hypothetical protein
MKIPTVDMVITSISKRDQQYLATHDDFLLRLRSAMDILLCQAILCGTMDANDCRWMSPILQNITTAEEMSKRCSNDFAIDTGD